MLVCKNCGAKFKKPPKNKRVICSCMNGKSNVEEFLKNIHEGGAKHWFKLHKYAVENKNNWNISAAKTWFKNWQLNIPNISCSCRKHWGELVASFPPNFNSADEFFAWTVSAHNKVNQRLEKPIVSLEDAKEIHGF